MRNSNAPLKLVYFALITSTFIYAVIVWVLHGKREVVQTTEQALHRPEILIPMLASLAMFVVQFSITGAERQRIITRWAIVESSTILALVATFISGDWHFFAIGWALSLVGFALSFPSDEQA